MGLNSDDIIAKAVEQYKILKEELIINDIEWFSYLRGYLQGYYKCENDNIRVVFDGGTLDFCNLTDGITVEVGACKVDANSNKIDELRKEADILQDKIAVLINEFYDNNGVCGIDISVNKSFENTPTQVREHIATTVKVNISI